MYDELAQWLFAGVELSLRSALFLSLVFFLASFVLIPRTFLCLGAGAIFGLFAVFIILPSTVFGGMLAFLLARTLLSARLQTYIAARPALHRIAAAVDEEGWRVVALLRFASPVPNAVQNYVFGLTRIGFWSFTITTFVFTIPQVMLYVYLGSTGRSLLLDENVPTLRRIVLGVGLVSLACAGALVVRRIRRDAVWDRQ